VNYPFKTREGQKMIERSLLLQHLDNIISEPQRTFKRTFKNVKKYIKKNAADDPFKLISLHKKFFRR